MGSENGRSKDVLSGLEVLDIKIIGKSGSFEKQLVYVKGHHPKLGQLIWGYQGDETVILREVIKPIIVVNVTEDLSLQICESVPQPSPVYEHS